MEAAWSCTSVGSGKKATWISTERIARASACVFSIPVPRPAAVTRGFRLLAPEKRGEYRKNESKNITGRSALDEIRDTRFTNYADNSFSDPASDHCILAMDARCACNRDTIAFAGNFMSRLSKPKHHLLTFSLASESVCCCVDATNIIEDKRLRWGAAIRGFHTIPLMLRAAYQVDNHAAHTRFASVVLYFVILQPCYAPHASIPPCTVLQIYPWANEHEYGHKMLEYEQ